MRLNLGCGRDIRKGYINVDQFSAPGVDVVHDLNKPLPFSDNSMEYVLASHCLEHVLDYESLIKEVYRVLAPGGEFHIEVPYGFNASLGHKRYFVEWTLDPLIKGKLEDETPTLDATFSWTLLERKVKRYWRFAWHTEHYLHIDTYWIPGKKRLITWRLRK